LRIARGRFRVNKYILQIPLLELYSNLPSMLSVASILVQSIIWLGCCFLEKEQLFRLICSASLAKTDLSLRLLRKE